MRTDFLHSSLFKISLSMLIVTAIFLSIYFQADFKKATPRGNLPEQQIEEFYGRLPVRFERNDGQTGEQIDFLFRGKGHAVFLSSTGAVLNLQDSEIRNHTAGEPLVSEAPQSPRSVQMRLVGSNPQAEGYGLDELVTKSNYFIGNDPGKWRAEIPNYARVKYRQVYSGVDLVYYGNQGRLEYDFVLAPGADPDAILLQFDGSEEVKIDKDGNLDLSSGAGKVTLQKPLAYQDKAGVRERVPAKYVFRSEDQIGFDLGDYDPAAPLVIDPVLVYSTYLGGGGPDAGLAIAVDTLGNAYITGRTMHFPVTEDAVQQSKGGEYDAFVVKLNAAGTALVYATYLGGRLDDRGLGVTIDTSGNVYVTGETLSDDFPTSNALQPGFGGTLWVDGDAFVTKLNPDGSAFVYSTYLGGGSEDIGHGVVVDADGYAYIVGQTFSEDFPTKNALQPVQNNFWREAFVSKIKPDGSDFVFSTYLGGSNNDEGLGIAIDYERNIYITGSTWSIDYPTVNAFQLEPRGLSAFVTKINAAGSALVYSTYLRGTESYDGNDIGTAIAVDTLANAYVVGETSSRDFPAINAVQPNYGGGFKDGFVTKFAPDGSAPLYSTYLGGNSNESGLDIDVDSGGNAYVSGVTHSDNFPNVNGLQTTLKGLMDAFVTKIDSVGSAIVFSTYLGGSSWEFLGTDEKVSIAVGAKRNAYVTGQTDSDDFPTAAPLQATRTGSSDAFVTKIDIDEIEEMLVVEILQDPLNHDPLPIANTEFDIYYIDLSNPADPLTFVETQVSDDDGLLHLPTSSYAPGEPFFIRARPHEVAAVKANHDDVDNIMYEVFVDNLIFDNDGKIAAAVFENNVEDTTRTFLAHTSLGFNLVVSLEWDATAGYVAGLKSAFIDGNNYLYDVANGQAFLQTVAIYDNHSHWNDADIRIYASNIQWPQSDFAGIRTNNEHMRLPPKHFGTIARNVNGMFREPLDPDTYFNYSTIIHELGHYAFGFFDEYEDKNGNKVYPDEAGAQPYINFGFMDEQFRQSEAISSEMSAFITPEYLNTHQYQINRDTCWEFFRKIFRGTFGNVRAEIHTPKRLGLAEDKLIAGPTPSDLNIGAMMDIVDRTGASAGPRVEFLVKDEQTDEPLPGVLIAIEKQGSRRWLDQGKSVISGPNKGKIRLFGAEAGDKINLSLTEAPRDFRFLETVVPASGQQLASRASGQEAPVLYLKSLDGAFTLFPEVTFDAAGRLVYQATANADFSSAPTLQVIQDSGTTDPQTLTGDASGYTATLSDSVRSGAALIFRAPDSSGTTFFVRQNLNVFEIDSSHTDLVADHDNLEVFLDSTSPGLTRLAVVSSDFLSPATGLPDSMRRASPVFALHGTPESAGISGRLKIYYSADSLVAAVPAAVAIFYWNDGWQPLPTSVDLTFSTASAAMVGPGFYAVFLDLTRSIVTSVAGAPSRAVPETSILYQNYPNPFNPSTVIRFDLYAAAHVNVSIYNVRGQMVKNLIASQFVPGQYSVTWNGRDESGKLVSSGLYFYRIQAGSQVQSRKMLFMQ
ncbi:MAG: SBBP repeat-containing protein [bacterium]